MNNLIFILHTITISLATMIAAKLGKSYIISLLAIYGILANLFVLKQITLFGLEVTTTDAFIVGISLGLNLLQEKWGKATAQKTIWISFFSLITYTILSHFQIWYLANELDSASLHFTALLSLAPRLTVASLASYLISQTIDVNLFAYFKQNYISIAVSQLADTIIFSILGLAGLGYNLWHIIIFSYIIKLAAITISLLAARAIRKVIKV